MASGITPTSYDPSGRPLDVNGQVIIGAPWQSPAGNTYNPFPGSTAQPGQSQIDANTTPAPWTGNTFDQVSNAYQTSLGRPARQDEWQVWAANQNYATEIANSPEAKAYKASGQVSANPQWYMNGGDGTDPSKSGGSLPNVPTGSRDPAQLLAIVNYYANQPGANPSLKNDPQYWVRRMTETAGWDPTYWPNRFMMAEGVYQDGPSGGPSPLATTMAGGGGVSSGSSGPSAPLGLGTDPNTTALFKLLMDRAQQSEQVSPSDPIIQGQTDAYRNTQTQSLREFLSGQAEKQGANGNITAEIRAGNEAVGKNTGAFQATLMGQELAARRQEIQQALTGASGLLTAEQQMQLQQELQKLNLAEQYYSVNQSTGLGYAGLTTQLQQALMQNQLGYANLGQNAYATDLNAKLRAQGL